MIDNLVLWLTLLYVNRTANQLKNHWNTMLRRISVEDIKKRKRDEDDSTEKTDSFSDDDEPSPKKARREKTEPLDLLAQLSAQRSDDKHQPMMPQMNPYMAMPHPMAMAMRYPPPPGDMKMGQGVPPPFPTTDEKGNNVLPPLSVLTNHLPPSSMPVAGYPYHPQMYAYPMYYYAQQGGAPFMPYFPNAPVRNFM